MSSSVPEGEAKGRIGDWRFVTFIVRPDTDRQDHVVKLLGNSIDEGGCTLTSPIVRLDLTNCRITTESQSLYQLVGEPGAGEPGLHQLLRVCAYLHDGGAGAYYDVFHVFYDDE